MNIFHHISGEGSPQTIRLWVRRRGWLRQPLPEGRDSGRIWSGPGKAKKMAIINIDFLINRHNFNLLNIWINWKVMLCPRSWGPQGGPMGPNFFAHFYPWPCWNYSHIPLPPYIAWNLRFVSTRPYLGGWNLLHKMTVNLFRCLLNQSCTFLCENECYQCHFHWASRVF